MHSDTRNLRIYLKPNIFDISPDLVPSPFDGGGLGHAAQAPALRVRVDKRNLVPPPLNLLPPGEERFLGTDLKLLETKSQTSLCKNLTLWNAVSSSTLECGSHAPAFQGVPEIPWFIIRDAIQKEQTSRRKFQIRLVSLVTGLADRINV